MSAIQQLLLTKAVTGASVTYTTHDPLKTGPNQSLSGGNLVVTSVGQGSSLSVLSVSTGKWYWEVEVTAITGRVSVGIGMPSINTIFELGDTVNSLSYRSSGLIIKDGVGLTYVSSYTVGAIIGVALDMFGAVSFYLNGVFQYSITHGYFNVCAGSGSDTAASPTNETKTNFGATPLIYAPPAGFNAGLYT